MASQGKIFFYLRVDDFQMDRNTMNATIAFIVLPIFGSYLIQVYNSGKKIEIN